MKLTIVTETFPPEINGVAMTFGHIARELGRRGHQVTVCHPRRSHASLTETFGNVLTEAMASGRGQRRVTR